jgi:hypothetical protein
VTGDGVLEEIASFRKAARAIVRDSDLDVKSKCIALVRLAQRADGGTMPEWIRRAIWEEAREFFGVPRTPHDVPGDPVEIAARSLRAKGYRCCPTCARELHGELDFARWRQLRQAWVEEVRARERRCRNERDRSERPAPRRGDRRPPAGRARAAA